jgi:hypothetical protein
MTVLQGVKIVGTISESQLSEDVFVIMPRKHIEAISVHTCRINNDGALAPEFRRHAVVQQAQVRRFSATLLCCL